MLFFRSCIIFPSFLFQSSPALTGGCYTHARKGPAGSSAVSILTRPYGRMLFDLERYRVASFTVSILTRPYGRMLSASGSVSGVTSHVSILTRPYGRMLYRRASE